MDYLSILSGIIVVNLLLSGDNALIVALASRRLPAAQRQKAIFWGSAGAIGMRILLVMITTALLRVPYLQFAGGLFLLWVAQKLAADDQSAQHEVNAANSLPEAIKTILMADLVMSLDNVVAIAGVAGGNIVLLVIGLGISIPVIIWGSKLIAVAMERWPLIIAIGASFLGWTAGDMVLADVKMQFLTERFVWVRWTVPGSFAGIVALFGFLKGRAAVRKGSN